MVHNVLELSHSNSAKVEEAVAAYNKGKLLSYFVPLPANADHNWRYANWGAHRDIDGFGREDYDPDESEFNDPEWTVLEFYAGYDLPPYKAYRAAVEQHGFELECYFHEEGEYCGIFSPNERDLRIYYQKGDVIPYEIENHFGIMEAIKLGDYGDDFKNPYHRIELSIRDIAPPHEFKDFSKYLTAWLNNEPIGHINADGYRVINIEGRDYYMHDLVYAYMWGVWPKWEVKHVNGNKDDNRWANLR
jgi:hypothetical protein